MPMSPVRIRISVEEDLESSLGRSSDEPIETDAFLDPKLTLPSVREVERASSAECPLCLRRARWTSFFGLQSKRQCPHNRNAIRRHRRRSSSSSATRLRRRRRSRLILNIMLVMFALFGLWNLVTLMIGLGPLIWDPSLAVDHFFPNWGLPGQPGEGKSGYPTDITRDVIPMPCHSHNDYWRRIPLYEALHYGCTGVEADVWLFDEELYVGHTTASLTKNRTLKSLYVEPLVRVLDDMNSQPKIGAQFPAQNTVRGVFEEDPDQTLVLLIDFKMDGHQQFPVVSAHLDALRSRNYLTYFNGHALVPGPITVVATGNAPFDTITANTTYRDIFFDAPLDMLSDKHESLSKQTATATKDLSTTGQGNTGIDPSLGGSQFTKENSYYASLDFGGSIGYLYRGRLHPNQLRKLRTQIEAAHEKGLKVRYWNTPTWPVGLRNHIWKILIEEGADVLNVDDLRSAKLADWDKSWRAHHELPWTGGI